MDVCLCKENRLIYHKGLQQRDDYLKVYSPEVNHSRAVKLEVLKWLIHRARLLCDLKKDLLDELNLLTDVFDSNRYSYKSTYQQSSQCILECGAKEMHVGGISRKMWKS